MVARRMVSSYLTTAGVLCVVMLVGSGCRQGSRAAHPGIQHLPHDAAERETRSAGVPLDLDAEYMHAVTEWREESRWAAFLLALLTAPEPMKGQFDHLDPDDFDAIMTDIHHLASRPLSTLMGARLVRYWGGDVDAAKRAFVEAWKETGPQIKTTRVRVVIEIMENVLKSTWQIDAMKSLDEKFPNEPIADPDMKGLYEFLQGLRESEIKELLEQYQPKKDPQPSE